MHSRVTTNNAWDKWRCACVPLCQCLLHDRTKGKQRNWIFICMLFIFSYSLHHSVRYERVPARRFPSVGACRGAFSVVVASLHSIPSRSIGRTNEDFISCRHMSVYQCVCLFVCALYASYEPVDRTHSPIQLHHYYFYDYYRKIHWRKLAGQHVSYQMTAIFRPNSHSTPALFFAVAYSIYFICKYFVNVYVFISLWK